MSHEFFLANQNIGDFKINTLIENVSQEEYNKFPGIRSSWLKPLLRSPAHLVASLSKNRDVTEALADGINIHLMLEDGKAFIERLRVMPYFEAPTQKGDMSPNSKGAKELRKAWALEQPENAIIVDENKAKMLAGIATALHAHPIARNIIKDGIREAALIVRCPITGLILKCKPDLITLLGHLVDFKSTRDAMAIEREIFSKYGAFYILNMAFYDYCLNIAGIAKTSNLAKATIIAIEKEPPYGVRTIFMDHANLEFGMEWVMFLLKRFKKSLDSGAWEGYPPLPETVANPAYADIPFEETYG